MKRKLDYDSYGFKGGWVNDVYRVQPDDPLYLTPHPLAEGLYSLYGVARSPVDREGNSRSGTFSINAISDTWTIKKFDALMERHDASLALTGFAVEVERDDLKLLDLMSWCRDNVKGWTFVFRSTVSESYWRQAPKVELTFYFKDKGEAALFRLMNG